MCKQYHADAPEYVTLVVTFSGYTHFILFFIDFISFSPVKVIDELFYLRRSGYLELNFRYCNLLIELHLAVDL